jgi:succinate dehydrogenase / fumarate reductase, membrane anchor subunit
VTSFRTPLGRAKNTGSAKHGVGHFIALRVSSIALVPLGLWALYSSLALSRSGFDGALAWLHAPLNAILAILLAAAAAVHMRIGMVEVVEDYIHRPSTKAALLILNYFVCVLACVAAVFCILKIALIGAAV